MNLKTQNAKNLISKDEKLSKQAAQDILNQTDIKSFKTLCENSIFLFDYVVNKIVKNLNLATNTKNLNSTFEFAKYYDDKIGCYINNIWQKYANEDLTDAILELLQKGTDNQKIYAVKYFEKINDPLALEYLREFAFCENEHLQSVSAVTLRAFNDKFSHDKAFLMLKNDDEFIKYKAIKFLINYGISEDIKFIINELDNNIFASNIAQEILYAHDYIFLKKYLSFEQILNLYDEIVSSYPEDTPLETILDFNLYGFIYELAQNKTSYSERIIADIKNITCITSSNTTYTYDLDKEHLYEIHKLNNYLKNIETDIKLITKEFDKSQKRIQRALNCIVNIGNNSANSDIKTLYEKTFDPLILCECARAAKSLNFSLDIKIGLSKIRDTNAMELFKSYF